MAAAEAAPHGTACCSGAVSAVQVKPTGSNYRSRLGPSKR